MPRRVRDHVWTTAACYHILKRGHARATIFHDDQDHRRFLELLARYRDREQLAFGNGGCYARQRA
jgi:hypothetical protein